MANEFYLDFNVAGDERKRLVQAIAGYTQTDARYLGAPSFAYQVGGFHIDRNGVVSFDDRANSEGLVEALVEQGFVAQVSNLDTEEEATDINAAPADGLTIQMPTDRFSPETLVNLTNLIAAKGRLIRKAIGAEALPVEVDPERVSFPWFSGEATAEEVKAYTHLVTALCDMARSQKRVSAKDKDIGNDKYAFRCFLLRLGFIGDEYKEERKILLRNLTGSSAFKSVTPQEEGTDAISE